MNDARPAKIALVNDDTVFLTLMHDLLEECEGYEVVFCKESQNAYQFAKDQRPDMVLLDIRIGGEEAGWTILELLTLDPATRHIPVIVCSAAIRDLQAQEQLLNRYGVDILPKPFDLDTLLEKVRQALARRKR